MMRIILIIMSLLVLLIGTAVASDGVGCPDYPLTLTVMPNDDAGDTNAQTLNVKPGTCINIELLSSAGTSYGWVLTTQNLSLVEAIEQTMTSVEPEVQSAVQRTGGREKTIFVFQVKPDAKGQETLVFALQRPWEKNVNPARVFELTVQVPNCGSGSGCQQGYD